MSDAPERIWLQRLGDGFNPVWGRDIPAGLNVEFVRADIHDAALARMKALEAALINERRDTLWNAYGCGIERDGKWMDAGMSDAEWLRHECGIDDGWVDADLVKVRIEGATVRVLNYID